MANLNSSSLSSLWHLSQLLLGGLNFRGNPRF
jgi:hypothetical protein